MGASEIQTLDIVRNIVTGKVQMEQADDLVKWKKQNEYLVEVVSAARKVALELDMVTEND